MVPSMVEPDVSEKEPLTADSPDAKDRKSPKRSYSHVETGESDKDIKTSKRIGRVETESHGVGESSTNQKVILKFKQSAQARLHFNQPANIPQEKLGLKIEDWLNDFMFFLEDPISPEKWNELVDNAKEKYMRAQEVLTEMEQPESYNSATPRLPYTLQKKPELGNVLKMYSQQSCITHHAAHLGKLIGQIRRQRMNKAHRVAHMIYNHFNRLLNTDKREIQAQERKIRALAKRVSSLVKQKWKYVEREIFQQQQELEMKEEIQKGKAHLQKIIERSETLIRNYRAESTPSACRSSNVSETSERADSADPENANKMIEDFEDSDEDLDENMDEDEGHNGEPDLLWIYKDDKDSPATNTTTPEPDNLKEDTPDFSSLTSSTDQKLMERQALANSGNIEIPNQLLRATLRPYQIEGFQWLAKAYLNNSNVILADEMGLGKTIQTITFLAWLACSLDNWGPHLIVVPTSVILNWDVEFKKFLPGFKVLVYYGNMQQRKEKRKGWTDPDTFNVCVTSYQLVLQDQVIFKRKRWEFLVLDEAHNIKNFKSQRWKTLLNINSDRRLLLTGTPLQNNITELWSLLYFLMPYGLSDSMSEFADLKDFNQWFFKPVDQIVKSASIDDSGDHQLTDHTSQAINKLHQVLRPYILRRLKAHVEKQMPNKYEHLVFCRLSKRQRFLYHEFMSRAKTKETLASGNFMSIINCIMQLRKVCNHPDLFETRPIRTSLALEKWVGDGILSHVQKFVLLPIKYEFPTLTKVHSKLQPLYNRRRIFNSTDLESSSDHQNDNALFLSHDSFKIESNTCSVHRTLQSLYLRSRAIKFFDEDLLPTSDLYFSSSRKLKNAVLSIPKRSEQQSESLRVFGCITPAVVVRQMANLLRQQFPSQDLHQTGTPFHEAAVRLSIAFPDKRLLQFDCGKLQQLALLLRDLDKNGHRVLIFTQMTRMLDVLEQFLNIHGYRYMRLDGSTKIETRQLLTEKFNRDPRIFAFILSTRSGGLGINLTGADTVIFYDSDWNPSMDRQCQDRCHRIGQTRDVHVYRLLSEHTIEENIVKKAAGKQKLDDIIVSGGKFTTSYLNTADIREMFGEDIVKVEDANDQSYKKALQAVEDEADVAAARAAQHEIEMEDREWTPNKEPFPSENDTASQSKVSDHRNSDDAYSNNNISNKAEDASTTNSQISQDSDDDIPGHIDEYMLKFCTEYGLGF